MGMGEQKTDRQGRVIPTKKKVEEMEMPNSLGQVNPVAVPTPTQIIEEEMNKRKGRIIPD